MTDERPDRGSLDENIDHRVVVAQLQAFDEDFDQTVTFSVDDDRFEVEEDVLYVRADKSTDYESEPEIVFMITADENAGSSVSVQMLGSVSEVAESI